MKKYELEHMEIWTKVLRRSTELSAMAKKEKDPARAKLLKSRAEILSREFYEHGSTRKHRGLTEEQLRSSFFHAEKLLDRYRPC